MEPLTVVPEALLARFALLRDSAERTDEGCLLWRATVPNGTGYAEIRVGRPPVARAYVHRIAWVEAFGEIPTGLGVLHHCDQPLCVEPSHLFVGTQRENMADMRAKGRDSTSGLERRGEWDACRKGHPLAGANLISRKGGGRECRACRRDRDRRNRLRRAAFALSNDALYPRDEEHRYRVYARRGRGRTMKLEVLACAGSKEALGVALVTLDEDERERGRRLVDLGAIGVLDAIERRWIVLPWHRPEETTRLRDLEVTL